MTSSTDRYTIHEISDVSTGVAQRTRVSIVVPEGLSDGDMCGVLTDAIARALQRSTMERIARGPVQIVFVFAWTDTGKVDTTIAAARALYIRNDLPQHVIRPTWPLSAKPFVSIPAHDGEIVFAL